MSSELCLHGLDGEPTDVDPWQPSDTIGMGSTAGMLENEIFIKHHYGDRFDRTRYLKSVTRQIEETTDYNLQFTAAVGCAIGIACIAAHRLLPIGSVSGELPKVAVLAVLVAVVAYAFKTAWLRNYTAGVVAGYVVTDFALESTGSSAADRLKIYREERIASGTQRDSLRRLIAAGLVGGLLSRVVGFTGK